MEPLLTWRARTRPNHDRGLGWIIGMLGLAAFMLVYSIRTEAWTLTGLIFLCAIVYYLFGLKKEDILKEISIWDEGVQLDNEFFAWPTLTGFWFEKYPDCTQLHIEHRETWRYVLTIQTGPVSTANIRKLLSQHIPEQTDRTERLLDKLSRICKI